jgi:Leu/Phe-tRNA-protein transferase
MQDEQREERCFSLEFASRHFGGIAIPFICRSSRTISRDRDRNKWKSKLKAIIREVLRNLRSDLRERAEQWRTQNLDYSYRDHSPAPFELLPRFDST